MALGQGGSGRPIGVLTKIRRPAPDHPWKRYTGPPEYECLLEVLRSPSHPEHDELVSGSGDRSIRRR